MEEVKVVREAHSEATGRKTVKLTDEQRQRLAVRGKLMTPSERADCCQLATPRTILDWFRKYVVQRYDSSKKRKPGRPRKPGDITTLVLTLAKENPGWGYTKIRDALHAMKIDLARATIASILKDAGIEPAPERVNNRTWAAFLKSHWETLYACDFFSVDALGPFGSVRYMVFFVVELKTRMVHIAGVAIDPDGAWMLQVARNLTDPVEGFLKDATHLIHDRDPLFTLAWTELLKTGGVPGHGIKTVKARARSPN